jgi:hypothetical protein
VVAVRGRARPQPAVLHADRCADRLRSVVGDLDPAAGPARLPRHRASRAGGHVQPAGHRGYPAFRLGCVRGLQAPHRAVLGLAGRRRRLRILRLRDEPHLLRAAEPGLRAAAAADRVPHAGLVGPGNRLAHFRVSAGARHGDPVLPVPRDLRRHDGGAGPGAGGRLPAGRPGRPEAGRRAQPPCGHRLRHRRGAHQPIPQVRAEPPADRVLESAGQRLAQASVPGGPLVESDIRAWLAGALSPGGAG